MNSLLPSYRCIILVPAIVLASGPLRASQNVLVESKSSAESSQGMSSPPSKPRIVKPTSRVETSVSVGAMAQLSATRIDDNTSLTTESLSPSAGVFSTLRQSFQPWLGYSVNFGYTYPTYRYIVAGPASPWGPMTKGYVRTHMYEISVAYIAQRHLTKHFTLFGEAGAGTIAFAPNNHGDYFRYRPHSTNSFCPEGIAGFGVDYRLAHGLGLRGQYRGLFVRNPFPNEPSGLRMNTIVNEPTLSLTYTLGRHGKHGPR